MEKNLPRQINKNNSNQTFIKQTGIFNKTSNEAPQSNSFNNKGKNDSFFKKYFLEVCAGITLLLITAAFGLISAQHKSVEGVSTGQDSNPSPQHSPEVKINACDNTEFIESSWNTNSYSRDTEDYYLPKESSRKAFLYPPMIYKDKISALFSKIHIEYLATYQNIKSTSSATLYISLVDNDKRKVLEMNIPEPNRQLIFLNSEILPEATPNIAPTSIPPIILSSRISFGGTNEVTITSIREGRNNVSYIIKGNYIDEKNRSQTYYRIIPVALTSVDPSIKEYTLTTGTGKFGKLKIKRFSICD